MLSSVIETTPRTSRRPLPLQAKNIQPREMGPGVEDLIPGPEPKLLPALVGGDCERGPRVIPVCAPVLGGNEKKYVNECIESNWISSIGPMVGRFERALAKTCGVKHAIACANGTAALHLAMASLGIGPGDEVILPTFTMIATLNAVIYTGATPVLVDADSETWNLSVKEVLSKITHRTKLIVAVHIYGLPAEMNQLLEIANEQGCWLLEDAAEAAGASYQNKMAGSLADIGTFSFYANKIITAGEGGAVTTDNDELADIVRTLRDHAFSSERHFWHKYVGFNYRMTSLQAAVGLAQLERMESLVACRRRNAALYRELLNDVAGISFQQISKDCKCSFWMNSILVAEAYGRTRDELRIYLAKNGIETRSLFIPMHFQPVHFETFRGQRYFNAELLCRSGLYLPSSSSLTEPDIQYIAGKVRSFAAPPRLP